MAGDKQLKLKYDDIADQLMKLVAVGMPVARHPPHRSRRALLTHRAPALGFDAQPL